MAKTFAKVEANGMYIMDAEQMQHVQQYATRSIPLLTFADAFLRRRPGWRPGCARMRALPTRAWVRAVVARHCVGPCSPLIGCSGIAGFEGERRASREDGLAPEASSSGTARRGAVSSVRGTKVVRQETDMDFVQFEMSVLEKQLEEACGALAAERGRKKDLQ